MNRGAIIKRTWISSDGAIHSYSLVSSETGLFSSLRCSTIAAFRNEIFSGTSDEAGQKNDESYTLQTGRSNAFHIKPHLGHVCGDRPAVSAAILEDIPSDDFFINRTQEGASN